MVTPTYGTATFTGAGGKRYSVDFYISDVVNAPVTWDSGTGAAAGTLSFWKAPEDVILVDLSIATGPTVMTSLIPTRDGGQVPSQRVRIANFLNTLAFRPALTLGFRAGTNVGLIQQ
jgi:hypothetical protein